MLPFISLTPSEILTVTQFLGTMNTMLSEFGLVKIKGEIEDVSSRSSYAFFDLKESTGSITADASVGCFVGWQRYSKLKHMLQPGMEVIITGYPKIYVKNGSFRIEIANIEPVGEGALQKAFEALKHKLQAKGYFDPARKRELPQFIKNIGLVTSMSGAAVIDFQRNLGRHGFCVEYIDVRVEGEYAETSITNAIRKFNEVRPNLDALILMRGGGSLESLKAFNSEQIADAIYFSRIPVITGIGHEKDDTIADFVADVRCSTPTAVAAFLRNSRENLVQVLETNTSELIYSFDGVFHESDLEINHEQQKLLRNFEYLLHRIGTQVDNVEHQLQSGLHSLFNLFHSLELRFENAANQVENSLQLLTQGTNLIEQKLMMSYQDYLTYHNTVVENYEKQIQSLNPEAILERGYSIVYNEKGKVIKDVQSVSVGDSISIQLHKGKVWSRVEKKK